jgi:hypothetical protein
MSAVYPYICRDDLDRLAFEDEHFQALVLGNIGIVTQQSWLFLRSFTAPRKQMLEQTAVTTVAHLGARTFEIAGEVVSVASNRLRYEVSTGVATGVATRPNLSGLHRTGPNA